MVEFRAMEQLKHGGIDPEFVPAENLPEPQPDFVRGGSGGGFTAVADNSEGEWPESLREKALIFSALWLMSGILPTPVDPNDIEKIKGVVVKYLEPASITDECKEYLVEVWADAVLEGIKPAELIPLEDLGIQVILSEDRDIEFKGGYSMGIYDGAVSWETIERQLLAKHYQDNYRQELRIADPEWDKARGFSDRWQQSIMERYS